MGEAVAVQVLEPRFAGRGAEQLREAPPTQPELRGDRVEILRVKERALHLTQIGRDTGTRERALAGSTDGGLLGAVRRPHRETQGLQGKAAQQEFMSWSTERLLVQKLADQSPELGRPGRGGKMPKAEPRGLGDVRQTQGVERKRTSAVVLDVMPLARWHEDDVAGLEQDARVSSHEPAAA